MINRRMTGVTESQKQCTAVYIAGAVVLIDQMDSPRTRLSSRRWLTGRSPVDR
jgi:hypothetical protein